MSMQIADETAVDAFATPFDPELIAELMRAFAKSVRAHQLYLTNNPMHARAMDTAREAFAAVWRETDSFALQITDSDLLVHNVAEVEVRVMDALLAVPRMEGSVEHSHEQHRAITNAIAARDEDAARAGMEEHLGGTAVILREILGD